MTPGDQTPCKEAAPALVRLPTVTPPDAESVAVVTGPLTLSPLLPTLRELTVRLLALIPLTIVSDDAVSAPLTERALDVSDETAERPTAPRLIVPAVRDPTVRVPADDKPPTVMIPEADMEPVVTADEADNVPTDAGPDVVRPVALSVNEVAVIEPAVSVVAVNAAAVTAVVALREAAVILEADTEAAVALPLEENEAAVAAPDEVTDAAVRVPLTVAPDDALNEPLTETAAASTCEAVSVAAVTVPVTLIAAEVREPAADRPLEPTEIDVAVRDEAVAAPETDRLAAATAPAEAFTAEAVTGPLDEREPTCMAVAVTDAAVTVPETVAAAVERPVEADTVEAVTEPNALTDADVTLPDELREAAVKAPAALRPDVPTDSEVAVVAPVVTAPDVDRLLGVMLKTLLEAIDEHVSTPVLTPALVSVPVRDADPLVKA